APEVTPNGQTPHSIGPNAQGHTPWRSAKAHLGRGGPVPASLRRRRLARLAVQLQLPRQTEAAVDGDVSKNRPGARPPDGRGGASDPRRGRRPQSQAQGREGR